MPSYWKCRIETETMLRKLASRFCPIFKTFGENTAFDITAFRTGFQHVKLGDIFVDKKIVTPKPIKDVYVEAIHSTHTGSWGMRDMAVHAWWPYFHRNTVTKTANCNPCSKIGKHLKPITPFSK